MTPTEWIRVATALAESIITTEKHGFVEEIRFFRSVFPSVIKHVTARSEHKPDGAFQLAMQSFSIAHQQGKDLTGVVNVVLPHSGGIFRDMMHGYLSYMERSVSLYTAAYLAAKKIESWENKGCEQPSMDSQYIIVSGTDVVMEDYRSLLACTQMTDKVNPNKAGLILISERPLDDFSPVRAASKDERIDYTRFKADILDPLGICKELRDGHT